MIAYLARSMPVDPEDKTTEIRQYGPNMPVAMYMMFSGEDAPTAKLPINIPKLDDSYSFTDTVLYARGFGLTYERGEEPTVETTASQQTATEPTETVAPAEADTTAPSVAVTDATSDTKNSSTTDHATPDQAIYDQAGKTDSGNDAVQTGAEGMLILSVLIILGLSALFVMRYTKERNN